MFSAALEGLRLLEEAGLSADGGGEQVMGEGGDKGMVEVAGHETGMMERG